MSLGGFPPFSETSFSIGAVNFSFFPLKGLFFLGRGKVGALFSRVFIAGGPADLPFFFFSQMGIAVSLFSNCFFWFAPLSSRCVFEWPFPPFPMLRLFLRSIPPFPSRPRFHQRSGEQALSSQDTPFLASSPTRTPFFPPPWKPGVLRGGFFT